MTIQPPPDRSLHLERETLLHRMTVCIQQSLGLQEILEALVVEMRSFLETDRVMIYKFHAEGSGQVVAESVNLCRLPSLLGLNFPADDIPQPARDLLLKERVQTVVDVELGRITQSPPPHLFCLEDSKADNYRSVDPCHAEYLKALGVKASIALPIFHHEQLWGLLVSHHAESKPVAEDVLQSMQLVVDQLSIAIVQSTLVAQAHERAEREAMINQITALLHSFATIELQKALEETVTAFQAAGGRLYIELPALYAQIGSEGTGSDLTASALKLYTCGVQPVLSESTNLCFIEQCRTWRNYFQTCKENQPLAIADLYQTSAWQPLQSAFQSTKIRSILIVPLQVRQQLAGYLSIFRDEIATETLWAGQFEPDERQRYPRRSFAAWRESKKGQVRPWTEGDLQLAEALGKQFTAAIEQNALYQHIQALNANLEHQVQERTASLQQATEQQRMLFDVVVEMRKSLDLTLIFATVTREVRRILQVDRVGVYQFGSQAAFNDGEFVAEEVLPQFPSALAIKIYDHCFGTFYATLYQQGRVHAVDDIYQAELQDCYLSLLEQFQVKATIVAPLMKGEALWGLFCVHQCAQAREWQLSEIQFATQVAEQLGVALSQADLLAQTQQQKEKLSQALHDLQETQTQLIQTEKMSSLGQLVAGIAHEINNPVNFIYGNLGHMAAYTEDLLELVALYDRSYPDPHPDLQHRIEEIDLQFLREDLPKTLASMKMGADRIRKIVLSLRNFSRLDQADMKRVDIHEGIDSTLLILQHRLKAKAEEPEIQVIKDYGNLPLVECYAGQLNQVFMNLISNAIDALEDWNFCRSPQQIETNPAILRICTKQLNNDRVAISIADNGGGIPETVQRHLFDPFFTTKPVGKGTGLGLSISYQIVTEKHGGTLRCISTPGQGAEFMIEIPVKQ